MQSLPFLAAVALAAIEDTRFNDFAYWQGIEGRIETTIEAAIGSKAAVLLPQSQEAITQAIAEPSKPADNVEVAQ